MLDITTFFVLISGLCAVISAFSSYKSSSIAKQALSFQENLLLLKNEINSILSLIKSLQVVFLLAKSNVLEISDDEFEAIPSIIQEIKNSISELKSTGYRKLTDKIFYWEQNKYEGSSSIKDLIDHPNMTVIAKFSENTDTLRSSIVTLTEIYKELVTQ